MTFRPRFLLALEKTMFLLRDLLTVYFVYFVLGLGRSIRPKRNGYFFSGAEEPI